MRQCTKSAGQFVFLQVVDIAQVSRSQMRYVIKGANKSRRGNGYNFGADVKNFGHKLE